MNICSSVLEISRARSAVRLLVFARVTNGEIERTLCRRLKLFADLEH